MHLPDFMRLEHAEGAVDLVDDVPPVRVLDPVGDADGARVGRRPRRRQHLNQFLGERFGQTRDDARILGPWVSERSLSAESGYPLLGPEREVTRLRSAMGRKQQAEPPAGLLLLTFLDPECFRYYISAAGATEGDQIVVAGSFYITAFIPTQRRVLSLLSSRLLWSLEWNSSRHEAVELRLSTLGVPSSTASPGQSPTMNPNLPALRAATRDGFNAINKSLLQLHLTSSALRFVNLGPQVLFGCLPFHCLLWSRHPNTASQAKHEVCPEAPTPDHRFPWVDPAPSGRDDHRLGYLITPGRGVVLVTMRQYGSHSVSRA
ncbi:MAG: hypothetical protein HC767_12445 [Akkermansiaceae bacterium]|nr:hypothetical protein [Akkermansiaceae bacterium]